MPETAVDENNLLRIRNVHRYHTNIISFEVRGYENVETEFWNLTPEQKAREIFVVGIFFDHLKCGNRLAKDVHVQAAFLQTHRYMASSTYFSGRNARLDEIGNLAGSLQARQFPIIENWTMPA
jgi:hypothetical protein